LYILAAFSWVMFQFYFDNYILVNHPTKFGNVFFFRNLGGLIGSLLLTFASRFHLLIFSIVILSISLFLMDYFLRIKNKL
ncbi:MAG: hypothetical protein ACPLX8_01655, partial [Nanopusillaceae archaeon]